MKQEKQQLLEGLTGLWECKVLQERMKKLYIKFCHKYEAWKGKAEFMHYSKKQNLIPMT